MHYNYDYDYDYDNGKKQDTKSVLYSVLLHGVKFIGEIGIIQFIFTRCAVYSFSEYSFFVVSFKYKKYQ
jgi:hypothetical protein